MPELPKVLAITVKPKPTLYWDTDLLIEFDSQLKILRKFLRCSDKFEIYPELFASGHWHYHIILMLQTSTQYCYFYKTLLPTLRRHLGFCKVKEVSYLIGWKEYCAKNIILVQDILSISLPITKSYLEIWNTNFLLAGRSV